MADLIARNKDQKYSRLAFGFVFDVSLSVLISLFLIVQFLKIYPAEKEIFIVLSFLGLLPVLRSAIISLGKKELTIDLLASIALIFSILAREWHSAAFINLMLAFARIFSFWTEARTKDTISRLLKYRPAKIKIKKEEAIIEVPVERVEKGDLAVIESGDRIPMDGVVISGQASVNESILTGESEPVMKKTNDWVFSSTLNESGSLLVRAENVGEDSTAAKIVALVEEASREKSPSEQVAAKFTVWYISLTLIGAIALYLISRNVNLVLAVLLVTCADDIAVAIPLSFTMAISWAAQRGILIKGGEVIEKLPKIKFFLTDKTGTLTYGKPRIKKMDVLSGSGKEFLELFGTAEINSHHPTSTAIINYLKEKNTNIAAPDEFNEIPGEGIEVVKNGRKILAGKIDWLKKNGIEISPGQLEQTEKIKKQGFSITALASDGKLLGLAVTEDGIRPYAKDLVKATKSLGVQSWVMLTGDNERVAARVAKELGIKSFQANLKPDSKLDYIKNFKKENQGVLAMAGDGVNDAAALALADVSIAMGAIGSDAAIEAADVALMADDLSRIPQAMMLGRKTLRVVKQNFWLWGVINAVGLLLVFSGVLHPVGASAYNFITDFLPIFNALRIGMIRGKI